MVLHGYYGLTPTTLQEMVQVGSCLFYTPLFLDPFLPGIHTYANIQSRIR